ncbi:lytic transglycosylase domain-containing protein [Rhodococcus sp. P1Y]|uniref:lytic transglycosylase domain-containing protein n=1 Tax=Rhodococcus sp. P1Y TaxID=1302308 RepID=UPI000EB57AC0|nr:lytic murein transglycosylase [Rhodococcus sp. P1Y]AYJ50810.1 lytic transglycosylase [Rhodococcus sp. P1Y]
MRPTRRAGIPLLASAVVLTGAAAALASASVPPKAPIVAAQQAPLPPSASIPGLATPPTRAWPALSAPVPAAPVVSEPVPVPSAVPRATIPTPVIGALGIPESVLDAYRSAEAALASDMPSCGLAWNLLAGIGRIESGHARGGQVDADGTTATPVLGPVLDGSLAGNTVIVDTDGGDHDGDRAHDRAVGPMQFIPGTWARYAADGNGDGVSDPNNVYDATLAAGRYLCSGGLDLTKPADEAAAVFRYNNSAAYVADVLAWSAAYRTGAESVKDTGATSVPTPTTGPAQPTTPVPTTPVPTADPPAPPPMPAIVLPTLPPLPCLILCAPTPAPVG